MRMNKNYEVIANSIINEASDEIYEKALKIFNDDEFEQFDLEENNGELNITATIKGFHLKAFVSSIYDYRYECDCNYSEENIGVCEHFTAVLLKMKTKKDEGYKVYQELFENDYEILSPIDEIYLKNIKSKIFLDSNWIKGIEKNPYFYKDIYQILGSKSSEDYKLKSFELLKEKDLDIYFDDGSRIVFGESINLNLIIDKFENYYLLKWVFTDGFNDYEIIDYFYSETDIAIQDSEGFIRILNLKDFFDLSNIENFILDKKDLIKFLNDFRDNIFQKGIKIKTNDEDINFLVNENRFVLYVYKLIDGFKLITKVKVGNSEYSIGEIKKKFVSKKITNRLETIKNIVNIEFNDDGETFLKPDAFVNFLDKIEQLDGLNLEIRFSKNINIVKKPDFNLMTYKNDNFFTGELYFGFNNLLEYIDQIENGKYIVFKNGDLVEIPDNIREIARKLYYEKDLKFSDLVKNSEIIEGEAYDYLQDLKQIKNIEDYELKNFHGELRHYQYEGYKFLRFLDDNQLSGILADDMGLGKTVQIIAFLANIVKGDEKVIIICPKSLVYNWADEIDKFSDLNYQVYNSGANIRENIIISSYGNILNSKNIQNQYYDYIIIDEAQVIKNSWTKTSRVIKKLDGKMKIALSGTPLENSLADLHSIFEFILPGYLPNKSKFISEINEKDKKEKYLKMIKPFVLRRKKEDVLDDLPEKIEENIFLDMTEEQEKLYKKMLSEIRSKFEREEVESFSVLEGLLRLRQISNHPRLVFDNYKYLSGKIEFIREFMEEINETDHKVVIFSQFVTMLDIIKEILQEQNIDYSYIYGISKNRTQIINKFNEKPDKKVLLLSLKAAGVGLNITGADYVIHFDPWWNPAVEDQATDRVYRIGQKRNVVVYKLITKNSIEEKILKLKNKKKSLYDEYIDKNIMNKISKEELIDILNM
ncbi:Superfamily II DNA or RNA helicase, SNF2 family [Geotoga petraea]|uniref:DEAD/DEAH box helicase n=2 Tax=Geotoga petraea TaxID=28234 RepID=A0A1G6MAY9_9BACT|nr:DEAD/DEAH box helicase [Geotoga petraea]SDC52444.1 Superfamily II DNA or RNA helicase, SNF2 family [Geotoga petraea]